MIALLALRKEMPALRAPHAAKLLSPPAGRLFARYRQSRLVKTIEYPLSGACRIADRDLSVFPPACASCLAARERPKPARPGPSMVSAMARGEKCAAYLRAGGRSLG
jgi:hypothetical protein